MSKMQVDVGNHPLEVQTTRLEEGPQIIVEQDGGAVTVTPIVERPDVTVSLTAIEVNASTIGLQGPAGPPGTGSGGSSFLPPPDLLDESDATYFYYGWEDVNGGWLVRRATRASAKKANATTGHPDLATAWANRSSLIYV